MNKNTFINGAVAVAGAASLFLGFIAPVSAETNIKVAVKAGTQLSQIQARSNLAIDARINALNKLEDRINEMKRVTDSQKAAVKTEVATEIANLTSLKAKID